jgi:putative peptidoglycan lipid II flippase
VNARAVAPGSTLAGRYRIEDLVGETAGSRTWRAFDSVLNRSVAIQVVTGDDPRCTEFLEAARRSTVVTDPRFLRVLDVAEDDGGITYTIREWARAVPLGVLLREGPLSNRRAASLVNEVAEAMASAHDAGVQHCRLDLSTIQVKDTGAVRITGLGTEHVLHSLARVPVQRTGDDAPTDPEEGGDTAEDLQQLTGGDLAGGAAVASGSAAAGSARTDSGTALQYAAELGDVQAIGRVLYACLVARWPGPRDMTLPPAPTEHGRLLRPRQVRAGVSRDIDTVVDRILGSPPRHHLTPLVTARDVAHELALVGEDEPLLDDTHSSLIDMVAVGAPGVGGSSLDPPPALLPASRPRAVPATPVEPPEAGASRRAVRSAIRTHRQLLGVGVALLVILAGALAFVVGRYSVDGGGEPDDPSTTGGGPSSSSERANREVISLDPELVTDFDPQGTDGGENPEIAPLVADGDMETAWTTLQYFTSPELGNLKDGVGVLVDLGADREIWSYTVAFTGAPTSYELYAAAPGTTEAPSDIEELGEPFESRTADSDPVSPTVRKVALRPRVTTRFVVLWLTSLPEESPGSGTYRGQVRELRLEGVEP